MIYWVASYPRSGNTLLRLILKSMFNISVYESEEVDPEIVKNFPSMRDRVGSKVAGSPWAEFCASARSSTEPVFIKTHKIPEDGDAAIFVIRDGRAALDSYLDFRHNILHQEYATLLRLIVGDDYYGDWSAFCRSATRYPQDSALVLRFEDLLANTETVVSKIASFTGITPGKQMWNNPFRELNKEMPAFFRKGQHIWQRDESAWTHQEEFAFALLHGEMMEELGYYTKGERNGLLGEIDAGVREYVLLAHELAKEKSRMSAMLAAKESIINALKATCDERLDLIEQLNAAMQTSQPDSFLTGVKGVIHVGASYGQERDLYAQHGLGVLWVEPIPEVFAQLVENLSAFPLQQALECLVTDRDGAEYEFNISNNEGMSSSILDLKLHRDIWPEVHYDRAIRLISKTLPTALADAHIDIASYDALIMDTQGSELLILQGAAPVLEHFRYIKTEAPDFEAYEGCCLVEDLARFLAPYGFVERSRHKFAERAQGGSYFDVVFEKRP